MKYQMEYELYDDLLVKVEVKHELEDEYKIQEDNYFMNI
jgi:hypothetical protein